MLFHYFIHSSVKKNNTGYTVVLMEKRSEMLNMLFQNATVQQ